MKLIFLWVWLGPSLPAGGKEEPDLPLTFKPTSIQTLAQHQQRNRGFSDTNEKEYSREKSLQQPQ